jgi:hypothetical protein
LSFYQRAMYAIQHCIHLPQNLRVGEPKDSDATSLKDCGPFRVLPHILRLEMLAAVNLDDKLRRVAVEIYEISAYMLLSAELGSQAFRSQLSPEQSLGQWRFPAQAAGAIQDVAI